MGLAIVRSRAQSGIQAPAVRVEVHLAGGLPRCNIVGLPETVVRESKDRVRSAIQNLGFQYPVSRITINLAPADLPKEGGRFDLPMAVGILVASEQLRTATLDRYEFYGELSLAGGLRQIRGALPAAVAATAGGRPMILPAANADEAMLARGSQVYPAADLMEVFLHLSGKTQLPPHQPPASAVAAPSLPDLAELRGQAQARRALEIAAAGGHNLLLVGPPGTGKTMLANRLPGLLPPLEDAEALETASIHSVSGLGFDPTRWRQRPFRAPHHTASAVALVGGGAMVRPGEISLAHHGVLFLDELPEFDRRVLEALREPLESGRIAIARAVRRAEYPARVQLVAAMNPCPCGYQGESRCICSPLEVSRYRRRISGPLLDRLDLHVEVPRPAVELLRPDAPPGEASAAVRARVQAARERQLARAGCLNAILRGKTLERYVRAEPDATCLLERAMEQLGLSARAYHRSLTVARSIADLAATEPITARHMSEALALRRMDRHQADRGG